MDLTLNNPCWKLLKAPWMQPAEVVEAEAA
jgi:hypothetical protein